MAKLIRHNYGAIYDALHKMIIAEVKTALSLVPGKAIKSEGDVPLCHILVSDNGEFRPEHVSVTKMTLDAAGELHIWGTSEQYGGCLFDEDATDWLSIYDFDHLMNQLAEKLRGDKTYNIVNRSIITCGYSAEVALKHAIERV